MIEALSNINFSPDLFQDGLLLVIILVSTNIVRAFVKPSAWEAKLLGQIFGKLLFLLVIFASKRSKDAHSYLNFIGDEFKKIRLPSKKGDNIVVG